MVRTPCTVLILGLLGCIAAGAAAAPLYFVSPGEAEGQVVVKATDSEAPQVRTLIALQQARAIGWSPDGRYFSFVQLDPVDDPNGARRLFAYDCVEAKALNISPRGQDVAGYWWAENSSGIAYLVHIGAEDSNTYDVYCHDLTPGSQASKLNGSIPSAGAASVFSADGRYLAFPVADPTHSGQVAVADRTTGEAWIATGSLHVRGHQWSLSGAKLALQTADEEAGIQTMHVADAAKRTITRVSGDNESVEGFSWRPGSTDMAYLIAATGRIGDGVEGQEPVRFKRVLVKLANTDTGENRRVSNVYNASQFVWSADGGYYAVSDMAVDPLSGAAQPSIKVGSFSGQMATPQLVANSSGSAIFAWSPDSKSLAFIMGQYLYRYDVADRKTSVVVDSLTVRDLTWSPDGRHLAVLTPYAEGGIVVWNVDVFGGTGRIISHAFRGAGMVDWSPQGDCLLLYMPRGADTGMLNLLNPTGTPDDVVLVADDATTATWYPVND